MLTLSDGCRISFLAYTGVVESREKLTDFFFREKLAEKMKYINKNVLS